MTSEFKIIITVLAISLIFIIIGESRKEVLEIQNNGATMCMACIGLE